jgi:predicted small secreted protein
MIPILIKIHPCLAGAHHFNRFMLLSIGVAILALSSISCGTARGFGQDVERTGDKIQEAASR